MNGELFDLGRLVAPCPRSTFFAEHWDRRPLLCAREDRRYFAALFGVEDIDPLLAGYGVPASDQSMRLVKRSASPNVIPIHGAPPNLAVIHAAFADGYTLNVNDLATHHAGLRRMSQLLAGELGLWPHPNMYLTPKGSRAFDLHFDTHDVLILQLGGRKRWHVYDRIEENPTDASSDGSFVERSRVGAPIIDVDLEAGDTLYVPRGFVHEAFTDDEYSLHVTVGMVMGTYADLLRRVVDVAGARSAKLRASIPPGALFTTSNARRSRAEVVHEMAALLASELGPDLVGEAMDGWAVESLLAMHPVTTPRFAGLEQPARTDLTLDEPLTKPRGLVAYVSTKDGRAGLAFQHGVVEGPWRIKAALAHVAANDVVRARDLPGLDDEAKLVLARRLVKEGVLVRE